MSSSCHFEQGVPQQAIGGTLIITGLTRMFKSQGQFVIATFLSVPSTQILSRFPEIFPEVSRAYYLYLLHLVGTRIWISKKYFFLGGGVDWVDLLQDRSKRLTLM